MIKAIVLHHTLRHVRTLTTAPDDLLARMLWRCVKLPEGKHRMRHKRIQRRALLILRRREEAVHDLLWERPQQESRYDPEPGTPTPGVRFRSIRESYFTTQAPV